MAAAAKEASTPWTTFHAVEEGKMLLLAEGYVDTSELETWRVRPTSATWLPCALPPPYHRCHTIAATYRSSPPDDA